MRVVRVVKLLPLRSLLVSVGVFSCFFVVDSQSNVSFGGRMRHGSGFQDISSAFYLLFDGASVEMVCCL